MHALLDARKREGYLMTCSHCKNKTIQIFKAKQYISFSARHDPLEKQLIISLSGEKQLITLNNLSKRVKLPARSSFKRRSRATKYRSENFISLREQPPPKRNKGYAN